MLVWILAVYNLVVFAVYGVDKRRALGKQWRIPERTLLILAACFGGLGAYLGMMVFRHKTLKKRFYLGVPVLLALQIAGIALLMGPIGIL